MRRITDDKTTVWQQPVLDKDILSPPSLPVAGARYLIKGKGSGEWTGKDNNIAEWNGIAWEFTPPKEGMMLYIMDENRPYWYITAWSTF